MFYLGREYDQERRALTRRKFLYDSKELTTHAVCVGMTGSGKTGLCIALLEEAAIDGIPAIAIDPKGDLGNLLLDLPRAARRGLPPLGRRRRGGREGVCARQFADKTAETWHEGLADWDQDGARIKLLQDAVDMAIYTPGSSAGLPLTVLRSFDAPPPSLVDDAEAYRDRVASAVSGLLALLGIDADPIASREHILLSNLLDQAWRNGRDLDLAGLIHAVQSPPFDKVGVIDLETFYPAKDRFALAMRAEQPARLARLRRLDGRRAARRRRACSTPPRASRGSAIISIAHLTDAERMFFVTILLERGPRLGADASRARRACAPCSTWTRSSATSRPRPCPPSKKPMLTLLKQARAFGLGVVLATQNPVDLDYKGLSNAGTWFLGRLQTERDKDRVLDGLEGASGRDRRTLRPQADGRDALGPGQARLPDEQRPRGPAGRLPDPLGAVVPSRAAHPRADPDAHGPSKAGGGRRAFPDRRRRSAGVRRSRSRAEARPTAGGTGRRPVLPPDVPEFFLPVPPLEPRFEPGLPPGASGRGPAALRRQESEDRLLGDPGLASADRRRAPPDVWEGGKQFTDQVPELDRSPEAGTSFAALPGPLARAKSYAGWTKTLKNHLYRERKLTIWSCPELKAFGKAEETARDFRLRLTADGPRAARRRDREASIQVRPAPDQPGTADATGPGTPGSRASPGLEIDLGRRRVAGDLGARRLHRSQDLDQDQR